MGISYQLSGYAKISKKVCTLHNEWASSKWTALLHIPDAGESRGRQQPHRTRSASLLSSWPLLCSLARVPGTWMFL